ncbi:pilus assembly protein [Achromobacter sp. GG226]|uniref:TadE/TadG family type IV pilus assembly protein n=1 Tax=Verticiella alkaliphila TaxID=2779529 RepID=UPI001C0C27F5|nr:TadE/TadG family type IV pilus assembly protein [Verticiella sp. GG226]MBU4613041.1 pilus assembly protein [Verticiella sp. GG226]
MGRGRSAKGEGGVALVRAKRQRGAYAVEFAFTFLILFAVAYAGTALAVVFASTQLLTLAAEDGARAALRGGTPDERTQEAFRVACARAAMLSPDCRRDVNPLITWAACDIAPSAGGSCLRVSVKAALPLPQLPLIGPVLPAELSGQATVRLDVLTAPSAMTPMMLSRTSHD